MTGDKESEKARTIKSKVLTDLLERVYDTADCVHAIPIKTLEEIISEMRRGV